MPGLARESHIRPMWAASVRALKGAAWKVFVISFVTPANSEARVQEMYRLLEDSNVQDQVGGSGPALKGAGPGGKSPWP